MTDSRRDVLKRGAFLGGALVPAALVSRAEASPDAARGPFDVRDFGGKGDGKAFDTAALQGAIDACHAAGGGTVRIPPGTFLTKPFQILSNVTLHLDAGALVLGSPNLEDYAVEGEDASGESERTGVVTARDAERVAIVGRGIIDGNALAFHDEETSHAPPDFDRRFVRQGESFMPDGTFFEHGPLAHAERPGNLIRVFGCRNRTAAMSTCAPRPRRSRLFSAATCRRCWRRGLTGSACSVSKWSGERTSPGSSRTRWSARGSARSRSSASADGRPSRRGRPCG